MKLTCRLKPFAEAFFVAASVCPGRTPKEILKNVLFNYSPEGCYFVASDTELGIRVEVPDVTGVTSRGAVLLPVVRVSPILKELSDESMILDILTSKVNIKSTYSQFSVQVPSLEDFPPVGEFKEENYFAFPEGKIETMIRQTIIATDEAQTRYNMSGVNFSLDGANGVFVATDGRRMAWIAFPYEKFGDPVIDGESVTIPKKALIALLRAISEKQEGTVSISTTPNQVAMRCGSVTLITMLQAGRFPQWKNIIPESTPKEFSTVSSQFMTALRQSVLMSNPESSGAEFVFQPGTMTIEKKTADVGESTVEMPIPYEGEEIRVMMNPQYIADYVKNLSNEVVTVGITDADSPVLFSNGDSRYIVMPLRLE